MARLSFLGFGGVYIIAPDPGEIHGEVARLIGGRARVDQGSAKGVSRRIVGRALCGKTAGPVGLQGSGDGCGAHRVIYRLVAHGYSLYLGMTGL